MSSYLLYQMLLYKWYKNCSLEKEKKQQIGSIMSYLHPGELGREPKNASLVKRNSCYILLQTID